jgi:translation initiation factor 1
LRDFPLVGQDLKDFAKQIKQKCGVGGTIKNSVVEIQGDCLTQVVDFLKSKNFKVKQIGG